MTERGFCELCEKMSFAGVATKCPNCRQETNMAFRMCLDCAANRGQCAHCGAEIPLPLPTLLPVEKPDKPFGSPQDKLSWDEYFTLIALMASSRGSCNRLRTACVIVKDNRVVATGYNGSVSGVASCDEIGHKMIGNHCKRGIHGEQNAIYNATGKLAGATAYVIATPCPDCMKDLLQNGIKRIVYVGHYDNAENEYQEYVNELCRFKNVQVDRIAPTPQDVLKILAKAMRRLRGPGGLFKDLTDEDFKVLISTPL